MKMNFLLITCIFFLTLGCQKKDDNLDEIQCEYLNEPMENTNEEISCWQCAIECQELIPGTRYDYLFPCFNPNNEEEFAYLRFDNTEFTTTHELWTFNYCTGEQRKVHDYALGFVDWSVKDWIIFTAPNQMIYKIKSSGDSLTQLTFSGSYNRKPIWNAEGNLFSFNTQTNGSGLGSLNLISNETGIVTDTVSFIPSSPRGWDKDNRIAQIISNNNENTLNVAFYDLDIETQVQINSFDYQSNNLGIWWIRGVSWLSDSKIFWSARKRNGITDLLTNSTKFVAEGYQNREYSYISVSPNEKEILLNRIDVSNAENCRFDNKHRIYLYNTDNNTERWIKIPE